MMNEPEELGFAHKIRTTAYPTVEVGGVIWAYLGPERPAAAAAALRVDPGAADASPRLEGHPGEQLAAGPRGRHRHLARPHPAPGADAPTPRDPDSSPSDPFVRGKAPIAGARRDRLRLSVRGPSASRRRRACTCGPITSSCRSTRSVPAAPAPAAITGVAGHIWVPMDDETTMVYNWEYSTTEPLTEEDRLERRLGNGPLDVDQTTFRSRRTARTTTCWIAACSGRRPSPGSTASMSRTGPCRRAWGDRRPQPRASRARRPRRHPGAPAAPAGDQDRRGRRHASRRRADVLHAAAGGSRGAARHRLADAPHPRGAAGGGAARAMIRAHLRRYGVPRPPAQRGSLTLVWTSVSARLACGCGSPIRSTPRRLPSGAASQLDPSHRSSRFLREAPRLAVNPREDRR